eukprot:1150328-Pelagomonas_calceolata.AAC.1
MLDENVSPAADQPDSRAVGQPPCNPPAQTVLVTGTIFASTELPPRYSYVTLPCYKGYKGKGLSQDV